jgi:hypothetical protein
MGQSIDTFKCSVDSWGQTRVPGWLQGTHVKLVYQAVVEYVSIRAGWCAKPV